MKLEMERAAFFIRVQNFPEGEDIKQKLQDWFIAETELDQEIILGGIEDVFRQNSGFAETQFTKGDHGEIHPTKNQRGGITDTGGEDLNDGAA